ncbi:MAG: hypothetical protein ACTSU5_10020 [Promethearchaeota archaeon]
MKNDVGERIYEFEIVSLEQIVGGHLRFEINVRKRLKQVAQKHGDKYFFRDKLSVFSPNQTEISHAPWTLIIGEKTERKKLGMLMIGNRLFGITPLAIGLKMQKTAQKNGREPMVKYLRQLVTSLVENPESWMRVTSYTATNEANSNE